MLKINRKARSLCLFALSVASVYLIYAGGFLFFLTNLVIFLLLSIPLIISLKVKSISLNIFNSIALVAYTSTFGYFYIHVRPTWNLLYSFGFKDGYSVYIYITFILSIFLLVVSLSYFLLVKLFGLRTFLSHSIYSLQQDNSASVQAQQRNRTRLFSRISFLIPILFSPLIYWMFVNHIGFTGIAPPQLPYKLTGILYYGSKLVLPFITGICYSFSSQTFMLSLITSLFAGYTTIFSASKGFVAIVSFCMIVATFKSKKYSNLFHILLCVSVSIAMSNYMRSYTQFVDSAGFAFADTSDFELYAFVSNFISNNAEKIPLAIIQIIARISSFQSLLQGYNYNTYSVEGNSPIDIVSLSFNKIFGRHIDFDAHHYEWQGYTNISGWYNGGSLFDDAIILRDHDFFMWFLIYSLTCAFWLYIIDLVCNAFVVRFRVRFILSLVIHSWFVFLLITNRGSTDFFYSIIAILILCKLPRLSLKG